MNKSDISRNLFMLHGSLSKNGYDWWWHNFTGYNRSTGESKSFFIEYFVCNPALGKKEPVLGQLNNNKINGIKPSYAMIKAGYWGKGAKQINNFYGIDKFKYEKNSLNIKIGDCLLTENKMVGFCALDQKEALEHPEYMSDDGSISWDIKIDKKIAYNVGYGASGFFRSIHAFEMFWHAEGIKSEFSGEIILNGDIYDIRPKESFGYSDKNWGRDFTSPWLWISSCNLTSLVTGKTLNNSALEIGGGKPKVFGISLDKKLLGGLYYEGIMYDFNFSKFWTGSKMSYTFSENPELNTWKVVAENFKSKMELQIHCKKDEMLFINYEAPNGKKLHNRLWNGGTGYGELKIYNKVLGKLELIDHISIKNAGCEYGEY